MESDLLLSAVNEATMQGRAVEECDAHLDGMQMISALNSTAAEVREVGDQVETVAGWADYLPADPDNYAAICIYDASDSRGIRGDPDYIAYWVSQDEAIGGSGIITAWARTGD